MRVLSLAAVADPAAGSEEVGLVSIVVVVVVLVVVDMVDGCWDGKVRGLDK